ncbi:MAG: hypothetical protein R3A48_01230 [Polyangiales bacterium]
MHSPRAALALCALAAGCVDPAHAQPRPDAGGARRWSVRFTPGAEPRGVDRDGGVPAVLLGGAAVDAGVSPRTLGALRELRGGASVGAPTARAAELTSLTAGRANYGGLRIQRAPYEARFEELSVTGPLTAGYVAGALRVAGLHASRCLAAANHREPSDVAVRFTVRPGARLDGLTIQSAPEAVERCVRAALARAPLTPGAAPTEVSAWLRGTARVAIGPARP